MGRAEKTNYSDFSGQAFDQPLHEARSVIAALDSGKAVPEQAIERAAGALLETFWNGNGMQQDQDALAHLYDHASPKGQARVLGELLSAGPSAKPLMEQIAAKSSFLTTEEAGEILKLASRTPAEQLQGLLLLLARAVHGPDQPEAPAGPGSKVELEPQPAKAEYRKEQMERPEGEPEIEGPPDGEGDLLDRGLSPESRLQAALQMGPDAIDILCDFLKSDNDAERELGSVALSNLLQRGDDTARAVYNRLVRLESDPQTRHIAETIRRSVDHPPTSLKEISRARTRLKNAQIPTGWLQRALGRGDGAAILRVSSGRQIIVIPEIVEMIAQARTRNSQSPEP